MGSKKRSIEDENEDTKPENEDTKPKNETEPENDKLNPMERRKKRKEMDKLKHQAEKPAKMEVVPINVDENVGTEKPAKIEVVPKNVDENMSTGETNNMPRLHIDVFRDLASADASIRKSAAEKLGSELFEVQKEFENMGGEKNMDGEDAVMLEAEKNDGLENCAESLRYAIRRLIRGVSSSRECARQGFALGLSVLLAQIPAIKLESVMKLIVSLLEVTASMSGQEAKDCYLGRLFAYGSIATSGRLYSDWSENKDTSSIRDFVSSLATLAGKKQYLKEPSFSVILNVAELLPSEAVTKHVIEAPGVKECFEKAASVGDPDALFLALKLREKLSFDNEIVGNLLPCPFSPENLFARDHLLSLSACFKESTFCHPRLHSIWPSLVKVLAQTLASQEEGTHSKKNKKNRKGSLSEDTTKCVRSFCEVMESTLLFSSHERKHLALRILLLLFPHLPSSCVPIVLSYKLVRCLIDILAIKKSNLHETGLYFMTELDNWIGNDVERRVSVIFALQKHSYGRFDILTRTQTVKGLIAKFDTTQGCLLFVQNLIVLFLDDGVLSDDPSDQSQADENTENGSLEEKGYPEASENDDNDTLKTWIVDTMPRILKNLKLNSNAKSLADTEIVKIVEEKFRIQAEIMKFLAVQGLFTASLGIEVTSFELGEKFKWPKSAISSSLCKMCIQQLQFLLEDAQKGEVSNASSNSLEKNDIGSYFMCFLKTLCNIPSLSIYRPLSEKDQEAFKKLHETESRLFQEERKLEIGSEEAHKLHTLRYVLIHLVLQVLLCPDEFNDASLEIVICCKKAFPKAFSESPVDDELSPAASIDDESATADGEAEDSVNEMPELMDVLSETFLSILPHSSGPMCFAIEQVYRLFSNDLTTDGILRMLRVIREDLKPLRHVTYSSDEDDDDDDDVFGIEDVDDAKAIDIIAHAENIEGKQGKMIKSEEVDSGAMSEDDSSSDNQETKDDNNESDSDMDDDEMLKRDAGIAEILKQRLASGGKDKTFSQLLTFKSRVLSLLEIFLQKHPGKSQVLMIYTYFVRAFMKYNGNKDTQLQQLAMRIKGILQKKIFKAKGCPKGDDILLTSLEPLLEKSLRSASRAPNHEVSSIAQASTFWLLKVIQSRNFDKKQLKKVVKLFKSTLTDFFQSKKSKLKSPFIKEVINGHPWIGKELFGFLLKNTADIKFEFRKAEAVGILEIVMKPWTRVEKLEEASKKSTTKLLKKNMTELCDLIHGLLSNLPKKQGRRKEVRRFCSQALKIIETYSLKKQFQESLKPEDVPLCEEHLRDAFLSFNKGSN